MKKVLLVTGGSGGIGRAIASLAAREGYAVALTYRSNPEGAREVVREIESGGGRAAAFEADLGREDEIVRLFEKVDSALGPLSALVNNAGQIGWEGRVDEARAEDLNRLWAVNVTSYFICAREAVRRMSTRHGGRGGAIVNVSSLSGRSGGRDRRVHYAASKGAINTFTLGLAKEVATEGVRVNGVVPAFTATGIHDAFGGSEERARRIVGTIPMGRIGLPEETAEAVLWLLSDKASFVTGTLLDVAGGS
ncbi:SDR family oxidoreductase [Enterovirga sp. CN4-39]|uniref:SDR family oxidoreductase n=1 Tax=Enterovirga sp. CN4-39 TaxID=3400910 RepID=UPI003C0753A1